jgi:16S rRNA (guanine1516-N2)-methyltransferase
LILVRGELALLAATARDEGAANALAGRLALRQLATGTDPALCTEVRAVLITDDGVLSLQQTGRGAPGPVVVNFGSGALDYRRRDGATELLGKAVGQGVKRPLRMLDATAGLGTDAFVLAHLGHRVLMCERDPVVVELLRSGLERATRRGDAAVAGVVGRLSLSAGDARECDSALLRDLDVIYLDPMFPQRLKSAAVKKEMALLQWLLGDASTVQDADSLLRWALQQDPARVVVKRPLRAESVASLPPAHRIEGKAVRYDVYVQRKLQ